MGIRKRISVHVDEELDAYVELSIEEIVEFVENCRDDEKEEIRSALSRAGHGLFRNANLGAETLEDELKMDLIREKFHRFSIMEWEERLR